jgi:hypothetical protein
MLTKRYLASVKNLPAILDKIISGTAPTKFTADYLKTIGFAGSNDRAIIPLLKDLGFLNADGVPTKRYHDYRNSAQSKAVLGDSLKEAYEDLFHVNAKPTKSDRQAIEGVFKTVNNVNDRLAEIQAATFFALLDRANVAGEKVAKKQIGEELDEKPPHESVRKEDSGAAGRILSLRHNIEVHLPATKDVEIYNAIFKALKEHLLD